MVTLVLLSALAAPGQSPWCEGFVGGYAHGYGSFAPRSCVPGGVVLPPSWPAECDDPAASRCWHDYVSRLDGRDREDLTRVWDRATPEARRKLLAQLPEIAARAAAHRDRVERERAVEKYRVENRPMSEAETQFFEGYYNTLRGAKRKEARYRWRNTDNRGRRLYLKEVAAELQQQEDLEDDMRDDADEVALQKQKLDQFLREKAAREKKEKEDKEKKDKEDKEKKDKEKDEKAKKDVEKEEMAALEQDRPRVRAAR